MTLAEIFEAARRKKPGSLKTDGTDGTAGHSIENTGENRVPLLSRCPAASTGQRTRPVPTPEDVLGWSFEDVDHRGARIKIRSRLLGCDLWLVGRGDPGPGDELPVYTTTEVRQLLKLRPETIADAVQRAHLAKMSFGPAARIEEVLPA